MFHSLRYSVTFPSTGRTLLADLKFETGFYAITGSNESGKTMILEMLRFLLFGSAALRGRADDYRSLSASGEVTIRGTRYRLERSAKKAAMFQGTEQIASGVTAVNEKVVRLLGYGLAVFDVANSINQGDVERLGSMSSAERKRLIDQVLGMDALELTAKWGVEEAKLIEREAEGVRRRLVLPVQPTQPEGYTPTAGVDLPALRAEASELAKARAFLSVPRSAPVPPEEVAPVEPGLAEGRAELREQIALLRARIQALPAAAPYTAERLDEAEAAWAAFDRYQEAQAWLKRHPRPSHDKDTLLRYAEQYALLDKANERIRREQQLTIEIEQAKARGRCTVCDTPFAHNHIGELETELNHLAPVKVDFDPRGLPRPLIEQQLRQWESFDAAKHEEMEDVPAAEAPSIPRTHSFRAMIAQAAERAALQPQLEQLDAVYAGLPDYEAQALARQAYEAALQRYTVEKLAYDQWVEQATATAATAERLAGADQRLTAAEASYTVSLIYEQALEAFGRAYDAYQTGVEEAEALEAKAAQYRKVRELMNVLRSLIKQHLMPSLNKVASHLLHKMTGGQRSAIYVSEDFDVVVDRQDLDTLSGSGKACANLALRIALGQVLTNRVFSVLLADEVDASMDEFRSEQTSNVLCTLDNSISQVLLVSHKSIEAINHIDLGELSGTTLYGEAA